MFDQIIRFSVRNRLLVVTAAALVLASGGWVLRGLVIDVFPDLNRPTVTIFTEARGLAPEDVETMVNLPIERAVNGAAGVERVRSSAGIGVSLVHVEFDWGTEIYHARQVVAERLQEAREAIPDGLNPTLTPVTSIMGQIMIIGLTAESPDVTPEQLRELGEWDVRPQLLAVPGVSKVSVVGGHEKQYQVLVDPEKLQRFGVALQEVEEALADATRNGSGGFQADGYQENLIRILTRSRSLDDLRRTVVRAGATGEHLLVEHLAEVRTGAAINQRGDAGIDGQAAVLLSIQKQPGVDTVKLTRAIEADLASIAAGLPKGVRLHHEIFRQSDFIERAVHNVIEALRDGSILVAVVLLVFLLNLRTTFITLTAIPLSLLITFLIFRWFGLGINTMTLGGLAIAIGELVDDAIVDVENVFRRLRENRQRPKPLPVWRVVIRASSEVRNSIVFATLIVVLVFLPLFALQGVEGRIFAPLGLAYIISILASLVVSLTVTPALCSLLLPRMRRMQHNRPGPVVRVVQATQQRLLGAARRAAWLVLAVVAALFGWACWTAGGFGREFLPPFNEGAVTLFLNSAPGTSLDESNRIGRIAENLLNEIPEVKTVARITGRAEHDEHVLEVNSAEMEFELADSQRPRAEVLAAVREKLASIPGVGTGVGQPISHRIDHVLSGVQAQIAIKVFGDDLATLRELADQIRTILAATPGIVDAQVETITEIPQIHVRADPQRAAERGLRPGEIARHAEAALHGRLLGTIHEGGHTHELVMRLADTSRADLDAIRSIPMKTIDERLIPLAMAAEVDHATGPNMINRENAKRRIVVSANASGRDLVGLVNEAKQKIAAQVHCPPGYHISYDGQFASQARAQQRIMVLAGISLLGMFIVLLSHFRSAALALQVMLNIPLSFIGAVAGVKWLGGEVFSIATMVGFITLTGISSRNGIMMISHYLHLMRHEGESFSWAMIQRGSRERIVPVLMTAITAALALLPLVLGGGQPGREILHPVAVVIFCGLFSSTLLDLLVTPLVFWKFGRRAAARLLPTTHPQTAPSNHPTEIEPCNQTA